MTRYIQLTLVLVCGLLVLFTAIRTFAEPAAEKFILRSPAFEDGGTLPIEFTGDGASITPPLTWSGVPAGTKSLALIMHHIAPDMTKWYWVLYNIPPETTSLPKNVAGIGVMGNNSVNHQTSYAPPHSKGPGTKTYILTLYALSAAPALTVPPAQVTREVLLAAMQDHLLGSAELKVTYTRFTSPENGGTFEETAKPATVTTTDKPATDTAPAKPATATTNEPAAPPAPAQPGEFHFIPPFVLTQLHLTDAQQQAVTALEQETKAKLYKILTPEQQKTMDSAAPPRREDEGPDNRPPAPDAQR